MPGYVLHAAWPLLVALLYALVTSVLSVLAAHRNYAVRVHDVVIESRRQRQRYIDSLKDDSVEVEEG